MLIIFGGLPGTGKSTIARSLAGKLSATYIRIDSIEQAIIRSNVDPAYQVEGSGYEVGYAVAADNLRLGMVVVADSVNPINITRSAWRKVAIEAGAKFIEVELICSDTEVHRLRVESRVADIQNHKQPSWQDVLNRNYEYWDTPHLVIETAWISPNDAVEKIIQSFNR